MQLKPYVIQCYATCGFDKEDGEMSMKFFHQAEVFYRQYMDEKYKHKTKEGQIFHYSRIKTVTKSL
jgi:hypothetical protein